MDGYDLIGELPDDPTAEDYYLPDILRNDGYTVIPPPKNVTYLSGDSMKTVDVGKENPEILVYIVEGDKYIDMACLSVNSLLRHYEGPNMAIFVYCKPAEDEIVVEKMSPMEGKYGSKITVATMPDAFMGLLDLAARNTHLGPFCCARYCLPDLFPYATTCLYLDSDLLFKRNMASFFNKLKFSADGPDLYAGIDPIHERDYYNSGILYMNLVAWRKKHLKEALFAKSIEKKHRFLDQDCINETCKIGQFDSRYNFMATWMYVGFGERYNELNKSSFKTLQEAYDDAVVLHLTGMGKFGDDMNMNPFKKILDHEREVFERLSAKGPSGRIAAVARSWTDIGVCIGDEQTKNRLSAGDSLLYMPLSIDEKAVRAVFKASVDDPERLCITHTDVSGDGKAHVKLSNKADTVLFRPDNPILFNGPVLLDFFGGMEAEKLADPDYPRWFWNQKTNYGWDNNYKVYLTKKDEDE